jgi:hypothetical protein
MMGDKITHLGLAKIPARSSISDANRDRDSNVFEQLYIQLYIYLALRHFKWKI